MALEIKVAETLIVVDSMPQALTAIEQILKDYLAMNELVPMTITISKIESTGPPVLGITVSDLSQVKTTLG